MEKEKLIYNLKSIKVNPHKLSCDCEALQIVQYIQEYHENTLDIYTLKDIWPRILSYESVMDNCIKMLRDRDCYLKEYIQHIDFSSDIYWVNDFGNLEQFDGELLQDVIDKIIEVLNDN